MLVLVSFGLVLLATVLLVAGLLGDGLPLIYASMVASFLAGVVLIAAVRMAKPKAEPPAAPAPLDDEATAPAETADETAQIPVAVGAATTADPVEAPPQRLTAPAPPTAEPEPDAPAEPVAEPEPAPTPPPPPEPAGGDQQVTDDEWAAVIGDQWDDEGEPEFPIADYDDLRTDEILPLLPQLYSDELDVVEEREQATKGRAPILSRIEELRRGGTIDNPLPPDEAEADDVDDVVAEPETPAPPPAAPAGDPLADHVDQPAPASEVDDGWADEPAPAPAAPAAAAAPEDVDDDWDEWGDDEDFFPIEDYDSLTVAQITPLLPQLYEDEVPMVLERERATKNRPEIVEPLLAMLGQTAPAAAAAAPTGDDDWADAPVDDWGATGDEYGDEAGDDGHDTALAGRAEAYDEPGPYEEPATAAAESVEDEEDTDVMAERYASLSVAQIKPMLADLSREELLQVRELEHRRPGADRITVLREIERLLGEDEPAEPRTRGDEPPRRRRSRVPIANYNELSVFEIRDRLASLSEDELRQVRELEHQRPGPDRVTVLKDIARRLPGEKAADVEAPAARAPIANYDELPVAEIRPRLSNLGRAELLRVREMEIERRGRNRKTILDEIDRLLESQ